MFNRYFIALSLGLTLTTVGSAASVLITFDGITRTVPCSDIHLYGPVAGLTCEQGCAYLDELDGQSCEYMPGSADTPAWIELTGTDLYALEHHAAELGVGLPVLPVGTIDLLHDLQGLSETPITVVIHEGGDEVLDLEDAAPPMEWEDAEPTFDEHGGWEEDLLEYDSEPGVGDSEDELEGEEKKARGSSWLLGRLIEVECDRDGAGQGPGSPMTCEEACSFILRQPNITKCEIIDGWALGYGSGPEADAGLTAEEGL